MQNERDALVLEAKLDALAALVVVGKIGETEGSPKARIDQERLIVVAKYVAPAPSTAYQLLPVVF